MSFQSFLDEFHWDEVSKRIASVESRDVERALARAGTCDLNDMIALLSPAALLYLPRMVEISSSLTARRFGRTVQLFIPLYLSNECSNVCTYCGFSVTNKIPRVTLSESEILNEARAVKRWGVEHLLLVSGEAPRSVDVEYFARAIEILSPYFSRISLESQPLEQGEYERLFDAGLYGISVYQETYHRDTYRLHHPKGKKSNFQWRLDTPNRGGDAALHQIGLGVLLGLEEFRTDAFFLAAHLLYLKKRYWRTRYSVAFPRLRPAEGALDPKVVVTEQNLLQLICAFRLLDEALDISLSTRERVAFRDNAPFLGVTSMSAGSRTDPGGYTMGVPTLKQFETSDERLPEEVAAALRERGYEPVFKDWVRWTGEESHAR